jgi:hypothetical protein
MARKGDCNYWIFSRLEERRGLDALATADGTPALELRIGYLSLIAKRLVISSYRNPSRGS